MSSPVFADKAKPPDPRELEAVLGGAWTLWTALQADVESRFAPVTAEWVFAGKQYGWSLRLKQKKRAILYMTPCEGYFRASFALGERAVASARAAGLPADLLAVIESAPSYPEGRAVRLEVRESSDLARVLKTAEIKMAC